jgi:hypothetical protein
MPMPVTTTAVAGAAHAPVVILQSETLTPRVRDCAASGKHITGAAECLVVRDTRAQVCNEHG